MELVAGHRLSFWDAIMLVAAADAGCRLLASEDMRDGFTWRGVTVCNSPGRNPLGRNPLGRDPLGRDPWGAGLSMSA
jgi:hypothetical protein